MNFYASNEVDDVDDFYECLECGHQEVMHGQRSAQPEDQKGGA